MNYKFLAIFSRRKIQLPTQTNLILKALRESWVRNDPEIFSAALKQLVLESKQTTKQTEEKLQARLYEIEQRLSNVEHSLYVT